MKVCHLTSVHRPFDTRIFHKECRTLADAGYDVTLVARHEAHEVVDGIHLHALPTPSNRLARMVGTVRAVHRAALKLDADLYHFHDPELIPVGLSLAGAGKPVVYDAHEHYGAQITEKPWLPGPFRKPAAAMTSFLERRAVPRFAAVIAAGRDIEEHLVPHARRLVRVANYPILDEGLLVDPLSKPKRFTIANFGGVWSARVTGKVVEALGLIDEPDVHMILGGRVVEPGLHDAIRAMPGWSKVDYKGMVDRPTLTADSVASHAAMNMYSDSPNHYSIRSNRVYEAMAAGTPVIVSDFPEWREFVERHRCGLAVTPGDPEAIAGAIRTLAADPVEAAAMGARGRAAVKEHYNWDRCAESLLGLYAELIGSPSEESR